MADNGNGRGKRGKRETAQYALDDYDGTMWLLGLAIGASLLGGALRIGLTRDGGALAIGVYAGADYGTEYVKPDEDLAVAVREISLAWKIPVAVFDNEAGRWIVP